MLLKISTENYISPLTLNPLIMSVRSLTEMQQPNERTVRRNREQTKQKLIHAAGKILRLKGLQHTSSSAIARLAGVDRKLISRYFGSLNGLLEAYVIQQDYWLTYARELQTKPDGENIHQVRELLISLLVNQFTYFYNNEPMQRLILEEIGSKQWLMASISRIRESRGGDFFKVTDEFFEGTSIDFRAIASVIIGGIYYTTLHSKNNDSTFCGLNLQDPKDRDRISGALRTMITISFNAAASIKSVEQNS
jgi:AcrR family transcriptional regulator